MFIRRNIIFIAGVLFVITLFGCGEFQEEEFAISDLDAEAYALLQDSMSDTILTSPLTNFDSSWVDSTIYENVEKILDSLEANGIIVTDSDTSFTIITPKNIDTSYTYFLTQSDEVVFFFDDFVNMNIIGLNGTVLGAESKAIPLETVYDCPEIRTRLIYRLPGSRNLVQIIKTDQTMGPTFRLVILQNR